MPRGGARNFLSTDEKAAKLARVKGCFQINLSVRKASTLLAIHGRGYSIRIIHGLYNSLKVNTEKKTLPFDVSLKVNAFSSNYDFFPIAAKSHSLKEKRGGRRKPGPYDNDLQAYMAFFLKKKLHKKFDVRDLLQECNMAIWTQPNLARQLSKYLKTNEVPEGKDLSLLKAVLYRQRLKYIEKETRHPVERLEIDNITEEEDDYDRY